MAKPAKRPAWIRWIDDGDVDKLRDWLARGGDTEDEDTATRNTPLIYAAANGHLTMVHLLLAHGAWVDGSGAFLVATATSHTDIARLLLPLENYRDHLEKAAGCLAEHTDDELLEELVEIKLKRLKAKSNKRHRTKK